MISYRALSKIKLTNGNASLFFVQNKFLSTESNTGENYKEIRIPVPWGHVAGKWWGPQNKRPILVLHGWQDNCGSFDPLLPLLKKDLSFLAVDFPGHGLSSRFPDGMPYMFMHFPIFVRQLVQYFKWEKVALMAHSLGGQSAYKYGTLYPETVEFIVNFDGLYLPFLWRDLKFQRHLIEEYLKFSSVDQSVEPPSYEMEELKQRLYESSRQTIEVKSASHLLKRNVKPSAVNPDRFYVTRDPRLRQGFHFLGSKEEIYDDAKQVTFPLCLVVPDGNSPFFDKDNEYFQKVMQRLAKTSRHLEVHHLQGTHHLHLNNPEVVADVVNSFIEKNAEKKRDFDAASFNLFV